eukprot:scaffold310_cov335-Pavlova_lutheri.AAC.13
MGEMTTCPNPTPKDLDPDPEDLEVWAGDIGIYSEWHLPGSGAPPRIHRYLRPMISMKRSDPSRSSSQPIERLRREPPRVRFRTPSDPCRRTAQGGFPLGKGRRGSTSNTSIAALCAAARTGAPAALSDAWMRPHATVSRAKEDEKRRGRVPAGEKKNEGRGRRRNAPRLIHTKLTPWRTWTKRTSERKRRCSRSSDRSAAMHATCGVSARAALPRPAMRVRRQTTLRCANGTFRSERVRALSERGRTNGSDEQFG